MKKYYLIVAVALLLVGGIAYYIFSNKVEVDKEGGVLTKKDAIITQQTSYEKDGTLFKFTKNRISKTANVEMQYGISDKDEFTDFMGEKITIAPFLINFLCATLNTAFYDPESLKDATSSAQANEDKAKNITEDSQFKSSLEGYKITDFKLEFKDKESNEQIASCQSYQKGFGNIKFVTVRDYSGYSSFLGQKIGVVTENK
jgi:hypothetical protein